MSIHQNINVASSEWRECGWFIFFIFKKKKNKYERVDILNKNKPRQLPNSRLHVRV